MKRIRGQLITHGVKLEKHEQYTIDFFLNRGYSLELIPPSTIPGVRTPDFIMSGREWEMKSPTKPHRKTIEHAFSTAAHQSPYVVFDLRHLKDPTDSTVDLLVKLFHTSRRVQRLLIITPPHHLHLYTK